MSWCLFFGTAQRDSWLRLLIDLLEGRELVDGLLNGKEGRHFDLVFFLPILDAGARLAYIAEHFFLCLSLIFIE